MKAERRKPRKPKAEPKKSFAERIKDSWNGFKEAFPFLVLYLLVAVVLFRSGVPDRIGDRATVGVGGLLTLFVYFGVGGILQKIRNGNHR